MRSFVASVYFLSLIDLVIRLCRIARTGSLLTTITKGRKHRFVVRGNDASSLISNDDGE